MKLIKWGFILCLPLMVLFVLMLGAIGNFMTVSKVASVTKNLGNEDDRTCLYVVDNNVKFSERVEKEREYVSKRVKSLYMNMILGIYENELSVSIDKILNVMNKYMNLNTIDVPMMIQLYKYGDDYVMYLKDNNEIHTLSNSRKYFELKFKENEDKRMYMFYLDVLQKINKECKSLISMGDWNVPLENPFIITQEFGGNHKGIDVVRPFGDSVYSVTNGEIISVNKDKCSANGGYLGNGCPFGAYFGAGNYVEMKVKNDGGQELYIYYLHLDKVKVNVGDVVSVGEVIGTMGNSGNSSGTHLHFEIRDKRGLSNVWNGHEVNPHSLINFFQEKKE